MDQKILYVAAALALGFVLGKRSGRTAAAAAVASSATPDDPLQWWSYAGNWSQ